MLHYLYLNRLKANFEEKSADSFLDKHKIASENATVIKENDTAWSLLCWLSGLSGLTCMTSIFFFLSYMSWLGRD